MIKNVRLSGQGSLPSYNPSQPGQKSDIEFAQGLIADSQNPLKWGWEMTEEVYQGNPIFLLLGLTGCASLVRLRGVTWYFEVTRYGKDGYSQELRGSVEHLTKMLRNDIGFTPEA